MVLKKRIERILRRLFHRKKRTRLTKAELKLIQSHLHMHHEIIAKERQEALTIDGRDYDAAVEKLQEIMKEEPKIKREGMFENSGLPVIEMLIYTNVPVIRVSKLPEFLLFLGIRIHG
jgi:hypothetical protein